MSQLHSSTTQDFRMMIRILPLAIVAAMLIAGCQKSPSDAAEDVTQARQDAVEDIGAARKDADKEMVKEREKVTAAEQDYTKDEDKAITKLTEVEAEAMAKAANVSFGVAKAEIDGRYNIEKEKCGTLTASEKDACLTAAEAVQTRDMAIATKTRDESLVNANYHSMSNN
jgi:PBP1b-binding outer membrane lipoprotein LpoB